MRFTGKGYPERPSRPRRDAPEVPDHLLSRSLRVPPCRGTLSLVGSWVIEADGLDLAPMRLRAGLLLDGGRDGDSAPLPGGLVLAGCAFVPMALGPRPGVGGSCPGRAGPPAVLATTVIMLAVTLAVAEGLGTVGIFHLAPVTIGLAAVGARRLVRGPPLVADRARVCGGHRAHPAPSPGAGHATPAGVRASSRSSPPRFVSAEWANRTVDALHHGMTTVDTLWYHMPFAARFVQLGSTTHLHYVDTEPVVQFYPANSELLHAVGLLIMGNDLLSPLVNLGWMALVLLAAWCVGRRFGVAPVALIAAAVLLGTPGMVATQPGGAYTDVVGLALFLAAIAVLVNTERQEGHPELGGIVVAALAAGLAFGTKFTLVGPVAVLTLGVFVVCPRGHRLRRGGLWVALVALTGGYWYVRNWVAIGNPLPSLSHLGPISLPSPPITSPNTTFGHYLFKGSLWRHYFIPGLRSSFGPAWIVVVGAAACGLVFVFFSRRSNLWKMVAAVGAASVVAFIYTPQFLGLPGAPFYFVYNLRYVGPALLVGLVLLPVVPRLTRGRAPFWLGLVLLATLAVTQLDSTIWPGHLFAGPFAQPTSLTDAVVGVVLGVVVLALGLVLEARAHRDPSGVSAATAGRRGAVVAGLLVGLVVLGYPLQQFYLSNRYTSVGSGSVVAPRTVAWIQGLTDQRIAVAGPFMNLQYQYYGSHASNYVQYVVRVAPDGGMAEYATCAGLLTALHNGRYRYLLTLTPTMQRWLRADPKATLLRREVAFKGGTLDTFLLRPGLDLSGCPATTRT